MENGISYYMRKHEYVPTNTGTRCLHCNSFTTVGDYFEYECKLRFNTVDFQRFLDFKNLSRLNSKEFIRRFSNDTFLIADIKKDFKKLCSKEETLKVKNLKYTIEPKL